MESLTARCYAARVFSVPCRRYRCQGMPPLLRHLVAPGIDRVESTVRRPPGRSQAVGAQINTQPRRQFRYPMLLQRTPPLRRRRRPIGRRDCIGGLYTKKRGRNCCEFRSPLAQSSCRHSPYFRLCGRKGDQPGQPRSSEVRSPITCRIRCTNSTARPASISRSRSSAWFKTAKHGSPEQFPQS